ncbi:uncharacterized protein METZ01_LOCUS396684, partial [marine metagenome]
SINRQKSYSPEIIDHARYNELVNKALYNFLEANEDAIIIGEDIEANNQFTPNEYGGAFKVTKSLSTQFPDRVLNTPISEAAIVGVCAGYSIKAGRSIVEIMFGDFSTLIFDQILQHATKFELMYNRKVRCPLVIRTPMGGKRGYGPTHSQSLEKLFLGVDGLNIVAQNIFSNAGELLKQSVDLGSPVLFIENKINYGQINEFSAVPKYATITKTNEIFPLYEYSIKDENNYDYIIITYGGMVKISYDVINSLYENEQIIGKLIAPTNISDFKYLNNKNIFKEGDNL